MIKTMLKWYQNKKKNYISKKIDDCNECAFPAHQQLFMMSIQALIESLGGRFAEPWHSSLGVLRKTEHSHVLAAGDYLYHVYPRRFSLSFQLSLSFK